MTIQNLFENLRGQGTAESPLYLFMLGSRRGVHQVQSKAKLRHECVLALVTRGSRHFRFGSKVSLTASIILACSILVFCFSHPRVPPHIQGVKTIPWTALT
jgi:hypothetical protein